MITHFIKYPAACLAALMTCAASCFAGVESEQTKVMIEIPTQTYVAIKLSGTDPNIAYVALNDENQAAYACSGSDSFAVKTWRNGIVSQSSLISPLYQESYAAYVWDDDFSVLRAITYIPFGITAAGKVYGNIEAWYKMFQGEILYDYKGYRYAFACNPGEHPYNSAIGGDLSATEDYPVANWFGLWAFSENAFAGLAIKGGDSLGVGFTLSPFTYIYASNGFTYFFPDDAYCPEQYPPNVEGIPSGNTYNPLVANAYRFDAFGINDSGDAIGTAYIAITSPGGGAFPETFDAVWDGSALSPIDGHAVGINQQSYIIGYTDHYNPDGSWARAEGFIRSPDGGVTKLKEALKKPEQPQIRNIYPSLISNTANGKTRVVFNAQSREGEGNGSWIDRSFAATITGTSVEIKKIGLPSIQGVSSGTLDKFKTINKDGLIASLGPAGAFLLLPVELKDIKKEADNNDDVTISPKATVTEQKDASIAWIEPHGAADGIAPEMPHLVLNFPGTESMGLHIQWKLTVKYNRPRGTNPNEQRIKAQDEVYIPYASDSNSQPWQEQPLNGQVKIYQHSDWLIALQSDGFFGGEAELTYQLLKSDGSTLSSEQKLLFSIGGKNPDDGTCSSYITTTCSNADSHLWFSYAIAKHESKSYNGENSFYNQFWEGYATRYGVNHRKGDPLWCKSSSEESAGGFGVFQITGDAAHGKYYNIGRDRLWNWQANVSAYIGIMKTEGYNSKMQTASRFFDAVEAYYATPPYEAPPADCTNSANVWYQMSAYDADVITLYNGAGGANKTVLGTKTFTNPWKFYPENASGWKWYYYINTDINNNNYLQSVIEQF